MKIRVAYTEEEAGLVEKILAFLRRILPGCRVKMTGEKDGFSVLFVTEK